MKNLLFFCFVAVCAVCASAGDLRIERRRPLTANVGVVSVGLDTYWKQCPGLLEDMVKKEGVFVRKIEAHQVKVTRFGMSDNPQKAHERTPDILSVVQGKILKSFHRSGEA